jgi:hypothetical protein
MNLLARNAPKRFKALLDIPVRFYIIPMVRINLRETRRLLTLHWEERIRICGVIQLRRGFCGASMLKRISMTTLNVFTLRGYLLIVAYMEEARTGEKDTKRVKKFDFTLPSVSRL